MGTAVRPAQPSPASWDAFSGVGACVDAVLSELAVMVADGTRPRRCGPKPALAGVGLRKAVMALWCVCFCGMQWRAIGQDVGAKLAMGGLSWRRAGGYRGRPP